MGGMMADYIYFIGRGDSGPIKIGRSKNFMQRWDDLQVANAEVLELEALLISRPGRTESHVHRLLKDSRIRGEWFARSEAVLGFIKDHQKETSRTLVQWATAPEAQACPA